MLIPKWPRTDAVGEQYVLEALRSHQWGATGIRWQENSFDVRFCQSFADYHGVQYVLPTLNGSTAIEVALLALGIGTGDKVLVPALTWISCATAVLATGAIPVLIDVDETNLCMDIEKAEEALKQITSVKAILLVHAYCFMADIEGYIALANRYGVYCVEDCSQSHGASWSGKRCGSFGHSAVFSTQSSKVLSSGEGGVMLFQERRHYQAAQKLRLDGRLSSKSGIGRPLTEATAPGVGRNRTPTEMQLALMLRSLELLDEENRFRRESAKALVALLSTAGVKCLAPDQANLEPSYYRFIYLYDPQIFEQSSLPEYIQAVSEKQIPVERIHPPIPLSKLAPATLKLNEEETEKAFPTAYRLNNSLVTLAHQCLLINKSDIEYLSQLLIHPSVQE